MCLHEIKAGCCLKLRSGFEMSDKRNYLLSLWSPSPQSKCFYLPRASKQNCNTSISLWGKIIWLLLAFITGPAAWLSMTKLFLGSAGVKLHNGSSMCYSVAITFSKTLTLHSRGQCEISSQDFSREYQKAWRAICSYHVNHWTSTYCGFWDIRQRKKAKLPLRMKLEYETGVERYIKQLSSI